MYVYMHVMCVCVCVCVCMLTRVLHGTRIYLLQHPTSGQVRTKYNIHINP